MSRFRWKSSAAANPQTLREQQPNASFDVCKMTELLDHDNHEMRASMREFLGTELFTPKYNIPLMEERELALQRLKAVCDAGYISVLDFRYVFATVCYIFVIISCCKSMHFNFVYFFSDFSEVHQKLFCKFNVLHICNVKFFTVFALINGPCSC